MVTGQAKQGEPWRPLPRLPETDLPEKPLCGPTEAPLAPTLCRLPAWKLFRRTATVKVLQKKMGSLLLVKLLSKVQPHMAPAQSHEANARKSSSSESADHLGTNYEPAPESKTHHFPKVGPRVA